jgi:hypothetical protein
MEDPRNVLIIDPGYIYEIPRYTVENEGIGDMPRVPIHFCRGDKSDESKPRQSGIFVESLIETVILRLETINHGDLATRETAIAITKLQEAMMWLGKRSADRKFRGVEQTYKP